MDASKPLSGAVERDIAEAILDIAYSFDYEMVTLMGLIARMGDETNRFMFSEALDELDEVIFTNLIFPLIEDYPDLDRDPLPTEG